ncbi:MAG: response regulator [Desulfovibrionaceae bacterium]
MALKILLIDDEESLSEVHRKRLHHRGYEVLVASSGKQSLEVVANHDDIAVAVLDVRMPGMDGIELTSRLKQVRPDLEIIILTAYNTPLCRIECARWGARDFLVKPVDVDELVASIDKAAAARADRIARMERTA